MLCNRSVFIKIEIIAEDLRLKDLQEVVDTEGVIEVVLMEVVECISNLQWCMEQEEEIIPEQTL